MATSGDDYGPDANKRKCKKSTIVILTLLACLILIGATVGTVVAVANSNQEVAAAIMQETETTTKVEKTTQTTNATVMNKTETVTVTMKVNATLVNVTQNVTTQITVTTEVNGTLVNITKNVTTQETVTVMRNATVVNITKNVTTQVTVPPQVINVTEIVEVTEVFEYSWYQPNSWEYALDGADPVAYFSLAESASATAGNDMYVSEAFGTRWRFSSQANKDLFDANPAQYVPAYGGHCAMAMTSGSIVPGDPDAWTVYNGVLYINLSINVRNGWDNDIPGNLARSDPRWAAKGFDNPH